MDNIKQNYTTVDAAKMFFCMCVVAFHANAPSFPSPIDYGYMLEKMIFRLSVPFFFVISGFFFGRKAFSDLAALKCTTRKFFLRMIPPLAVYSVLNGFCDYIKITAQEQKSAWQAIYTIIRHALFFPRGGLWYLQASVVAVLLLYVFIKRDKLWLALIISGTLYAGSLLGNTYYFLLDGTPFRCIADKYLEIFLTVRNGLFTGFFFMGAGAALGRYNLTVKTKWIITVGIISYATLFLETIYTYNKRTADQHSHFLSYMVLIPAIASLCLRFNMTLPLPYVRLRMLSAGIFFLHTPVMSTVGAAGIVLGISVSDNLKFLAAFTVSAGICLLAYKSKIRFLIKLTS